MIPPEAAERFALSKNTDMRNDKAMVEMPYIVKKQNISERSASRRIPPF